MISLKVDQKFQAPLEKISGYATAWHVNRESLFLVQYCFSGLVQRIFNCDKTQDNSLTPDNVLNILMYGSPVRIITYMS